MPMLEVDFTVYCLFKIPEGIHLLNPNDNTKAIDSKQIVPFSWWIKWRTLHYIDADGKECEIKGDLSDERFKYHDQGSEIFKDNTEWDTEFDWKGRK